MMLVEVIPDQTDTVIKIRGSEFVVVEEMSLPIGQNIGMEIFVEVFCEITAGKSQNDLIFKILIHRQGTAVDDGLTIDFFFILKDRFQHRGFESEIG